MKIGIVTDSTADLPAYLIEQHDVQVVSSVLVLEGISRLMNGAGQFIPGKLGITEAASAALSASLQLGAAHGLSLALARRVRSLAWGTVGIAVVAMRAARTRQAQPAPYFIAA